MSEPRFSELAGGHRVQIVPAEQLRPGDRLAYRGRGGSVLWFPVAKVQPLTAKTVRVAIDDGDLAGVLGGYSWNSRRRKTPMAIAPRRVYLAQVLVDDPGQSPYVIDESTRPDAAAAAEWLAERLERAPERQAHRLSGYAYPGEWVTLDYAGDDREFQYDEDAPESEHVVFAADAGAVSQTAGPRT